METLFLIASSEINYVKDGVARKLFKLLCKKIDGSDVECVTSSSPTGEVVYAKFVKNGEVLYTGTSGPVKATQDQYSVQYFTSKDLFGRAKAAKASIADMEW